MPTQSFAARRAVLLAGLGAVLCLPLVAPSVAHEVKAGSLTLNHPWVRATPTGATVGGGYVEIVNAGNEPDRLLGGSAPFAARVEIHEMKVTDGIMTMREVPGGLEIPAGGTLVLKPGSFHLMFMELTEPLQADMMVDGMLTFEKAGDVPVTFMVEAMGAAGGHDAMGHGDPAAPAD
jgi:copper(I)-binding protein